MMYGQRNIKLDNRPVNVSQNKGCTHLAKSRRNLIISSGRRGNKKRSTLRDHKYQSPLYKNLVATATWRQWFVQFDKLRKIRGGGFHNKIPYKIKTIYTIVIHRTGGKKYSFFMRHRFIVSCISNLSVAYPGILFGVGFNKFSWG